MKEEQLQEMLGMVRESLRPSLFARLMRDLGVFVLVFGILVGAYNIANGETFTGGLLFTLTFVIYANIVIFTSYLERVDIG